VKLLNAFEADNHELGLLYCKDFFSIVAKKDDVNYWKMLGLASQACQQTTRYQEALEFALERFNVSKQLSEVPSSDFAIFFAGVAALYFKLKMVHKAIEFQEQAVAALAATRGPNHVCTILRPSRK
jgi:tetratricopeptide (TPR) repeat protein